ncbi:MAG: hypothetical protein KGR24_05925 [Planctomycetes bacterium]|nr:hypothetical protein [Planctomycetota bacterium]
MADSMSGSVTNESEGGEVREVKRRWVIGRCQGFDDAVDQISLYAPPYASLSGYFAVRSRLDVSGIGNRYFDCTATYRTLLPKPDDEGDGGGGGGGGGGESNFVPGSGSWDTSGTTERMYQALSETGYPEESAAYMEEAINVNGGSVEGVDVVKPGMRYSETWIVPAATAFSYEYMGAVHRLTGTVNDEPFRAFDPGEALFMGARLQYQGDQPYASITFEFECRPNEPDFTVSGHANVTFSKEGWDYVWIRYEDAVSDGSLIRRAIAVYKNQIYKKGDWAGLGINSGQIGLPKNPRVPGQPNAAQAAQAFLN